MLQGQHECGQVHCWGEKKRDQNNYILERKSLFRIIPYNIWTQWAAVATQLDFIRAPPQNGNPVSRTWMETWYGSSPEIKNFNWKL